MTSRLLLPLITAALAISMTACFTGIESTPAITQRDVKKQNIVDAPGKHLLDSVVPAAPRQWKTGREFYIADNRAARAAWAVFPAVMADSLAGTIAVFTGTDTVPTLTGRTEIQLNFSIPVRDALMQYRTGRTPAEWESLDDYTLPHLIDMETVHRAAEILVGRTCYILPARRLTMAGADTIGRRYDRVIITDVRPHTEQTPLRVSFVDGQGHTASVLMTLGHRTVARRNFDTLFELEDPRRQHNDIADDIWELICQSRVTQGMTPAQCRLALGAPDNYRRIPTTAGMVERWTYTNGAYLLFEDGVLTSFRL